MAGSPPGATALSLARSPIYPAGAGGEGGAATLHELADAAGVHLNTARAHVSALEDAGQPVRESGARRGRGRPRTRYRLAEGWIPPTGDYRALAELLGTALVGGGPHPADVRAVGLEWGRWLLGRPGDHDLRRELPRALERLGFHAEMDRHVLSLSACPCALVAPDRPRLVCELATAVSDGVLAR